MEPRRLAVTNNTFQFQVEAVSTEKSVRVRVKVYDNTTSIYSQDIEITAGEGTFVVPAILADSDVIALQVCFYSSLLTIRENARAVELNCFSENGKQYTPFECGVGNTLCLDGLNLLPVFPFRCFRESESKRGFIICRQLHES